MAVNRREFPVPPAGVQVLGEDDSALSTDRKYSQGLFRQVRNYHLGFNGAVKRQGMRAYRAIGDTPIDAGHAVQSLHVYDFAGTRRLVALCNGALYYWAGTAWTDITGTLTFGSDSEDRLRATMFNDGSSSYLVGCDGANQLWKWDGTASPATGLGGTPPGCAKGVAQFQGRLFVIGTDASPTEVVYSDDGTIDTWGSGQLFHCFRSSEGMALAAHSQDALIAFHRHGWARITFNYVETGLVDSYFTQVPVGDNGLVGPDAYVTFHGSTYYASDDGIHRISDPTQMDKLISGPIESYWRGLILTRKKYIQAFAGGQWDEVVFLVSDTDSSTMDAAIVYNPAIAQHHADAGWTIYDNPGGYMRVNCGVTWRDANEQQITLLGGYDGVVYEAWGSDEYPTSYTDGEQPVPSVLLTGFLDLGANAWVKGLRALQMDWRLASDVAFTIKVYGSNWAPTIANTSTVVGGGEDSIGVDFKFDESYFAASEGVQDYELDGIDGSARFFQAELREANTGGPHTYNGMRFMFLPERKGII